MRRRLSLRSRFIVWTSAAVVVTSIALMISVYDVSSRAMEKQAGEEIRAVVARTTGELDLWVEARERDAVNLSELQPLVEACTSHKLDAAQQTLDRIQGRSPFYENVFLAGVDGRIFLDSIGGKSVGIDLTSMDAFRANAEHARHGELWFGEVNKSPATGRPVALLTAPIRAGTRLSAFSARPLSCPIFPTLL